MPQPESEFSISGYCIPLESPKLFPQSANISLCQVLICIVIARILDHRCGSRSGLEPNCFKIGGLNCQNTWTVKWGTVQWYSPNPSEMGGLSVGCPVGPSVDSYNAFAFAF
jgi:hypothetical protein